MTVTERFLKYVSFETTSDENSTTQPSSLKELELGKYIAAELDAIGLCDAHMDDKGYVYAYLPASPGCEDEKTGLIAHMDTSPDASGANIKPRIIKYSGGDVVLNEKLTMKLQDYPRLSRYIGQELIVTDGTTLLGADDKAGIAETVSAMEYLIAHPGIRHGRVSVCFTPDEEIGCGADHFDLAKFNADFAYTVDGGTLGEIEYENFNAASACVRIHGFNIHPGEAYGRMKNAVLYAAEYISMLPKDETPAGTKDYQGFYHVTDTEGCESEAEVRMIIRDHDRESFEARKQNVKRIADELNEKYGEGTFECAVKDSYYNMKEKILPVMHIVERAKEAFEKCGVTPAIVPIRGGTDGARLSYEGLPCPNLSAGGENFHSVYEYVPVQSLEKMTEVLTDLMRYRG